MDTPWIDVNVKVPDQNQEVIVWAQSARGEIYFESDEPTYYKVIWSSKESSNTVPCDCYSIKVYNITHWMPSLNSPLTFKT